MINSFFRSLKIIFYLSIVILFYLLYLSRDLPSLERLETFDPAMLSTIYDRNGEIIGDVFDGERENIKNIAEQATKFNLHPVALVFDGDRGTAFETVGDDSSAKAFIDPTNILYGTINSELGMVNEGWQYDSTNQEWKVIGNLQLTVVEVV